MLKEYLNMEIWMRKYTSISLEDLFNIAKEGLFVS